MVSMFSEVREEGLGEESEVACQADWEGEIQGREGPEGVEREVGNEVGGQKGGKDYCGVGVGVRVGIGWWDDSGIG